MSKLISACCRADMIVVGDSFGEGTNHYECKACKEACNFIDPEQELIENAKLAKSQTDNTELRKLRKEIAKCFYDEKIMESDHDDWDENSIEYFDTPIVITKIAKYIQAQLKQQDIKSRIDELNILTPVAESWVAKHYSYLGVNYVNDRLTQLKENKI